MTDEGIVSREALAKSKLGERTLHELFVSNMVHSSIKRMLWKKVGRQRHVPWLVESEILFRTIQWIMRRHEGNVGEEGGSLAFPTFEKLHTGVGEVIRIEATR